jgi:uncharacterized protein
LREVICNTSPFQYLEGLGLLSILPALAGRIVVPPAVVDELAAGTAKGLSLPDVARLDWVEIRRPRGVAAVPLVLDLGAGETEVLALALEVGEALAILDDGLARCMATALGIAVEGTLGLLVDAKKTGLVKTVVPLLDQLDALRFRIHPRTRAVILRLAGEGA